MLHAFTSYVQKKKDDANQTLYYEAPGGTTEPIGHELWAYIPQSVLPHLKWTASTDYTHTYYVNSQPRVFDAKVLPDDMHYTDDNTNPNYGTFMVFGLNMGGKDISVNEDFGSGTNTVRDFSPTYVLMDITDPRKPRVLWERSYTGLGMSVSPPAPVHIGTLDSDSGKWLLVFGSGTTDYDHAPGNLDKGRIFVVDMLTGEPYGTSATEDWIWESSRDSYFNAPMAMDLFLSNNVDAIYLAENYYSNSGSEWRADIKKITIPCSKCPWSEDIDGNVLYGRDEYEYSADPYAWSMSTLFEADGPVTAKLNSSTDPLGNWLFYFGTGRYTNGDDKTDTNQQYLYCVKDPFYNPKYDGSYYHDFGSVLTLGPADLMDSDNIVVTSKGKVSGYSGYTDFYEFRDHVRETEDGWSLSLLDNSPEPAERIISQVAVYGGLFLTPTFSPTYDVCSMGGETTFLAGYYETGTGYIKPVFTELPDGAAETDIGIRSPSSYIGMPPSRLVLHVGQEKGTMVTIQLGTGELLQFTGITATSNDNAVMEYTDDPTQAPTKNPACDWGNDDTNLVTGFPSGPSGP
jgi:type IV pilus assembly protein PilY1